MSRSGVPRDGDLILSIDAGTQSMRAGLVDLAGNATALVKNAIEPYVSPRPGWAEQDPDYYWRMLGQTTRQLLADNPGAAERLCAVTLTTQRHTFVNVDRDGSALRPAIVWLDSRKADMRQVLPLWAIGLARVIGQYQQFAYSSESSRSNWIRQNQPDVWAQTHKFLFLSGFLTLRLTGEFVDSDANILGAVPFDVKKRQWASGGLKQSLIPIEREKLPDTVPPGAQLGAVTAKASEETGIPAGLPMIAAANDKACDVIGSGCLTPERACISFGTIATINTATSRYVELSPFAPSWPSAIPGEYYTEASVFRGVWMVSWFRDQFGLRERQLAEGTDSTPEELLEELIREVPPGSMGLVCQPFWTPGFNVDPRTKGALFGFGDVHGRAHVYRAILEGLIFALKEGGEMTQQKTGIPFTSIRATGGASKSDAIVQMTADIFGLPVARPESSETSVLGAAMVAAVGVGAYRDVPAAVAGMSRDGASFEPNPETERVYRGLYEQVYVKAYERLLPLYREIAEITGYPAR